MSLGLTGLQSNPLFNNNQGLGRIGVTAYLLGVIGGYNLSFLINPVWSIIFFQFNYAINNVNWLIFNISGYFFLLSFFHFTEFFSTAMYKPRDTSYNSFVVNHSLAYTAASIAAIIEYSIEYFLFPSLKKEMYLMYILGFLISITGQSKCSFVCHLRIYVYIYIYSYFVSTIILNGKRLTS